MYPFDRARQERALAAVARWARDYRIATILGTERFTKAGRQIAAYVFDAGGELQGFQTKNQLDPTEDKFYVPGNTRRLFEAGGVKFGVTICHEGWRYPETCVGPRRAREDSLSPAAHRPRARGSSSERAGRIGLAVPRRR